MPLGTAEGGVTTDEQSAPDCDMKPSRPLSGIWTAKDALSGQIVSMTPRTSGR